MGDVDIGLDAGMDTLVTPSYAVKIPLTAFLHNVTLNRDLLPLYIAHDTCPDVRVCLHLMAPPNIHMTPGIESSVQDTVICRKKRLKYLWNSQRLSFPISISVLPHTAYLRVEVYSNQMLVGSTELPVYDEHFALRSTMHTCPVTPTIYADNPLLQQLPGFEVSFELAIPQDEGRARTITNTVCYAPEGLFAKTSVASITATVDAHMTKATSPQQLTLADINQLVSPSISADADLALAHKVAEHYYRVSMKGALYFNRHLLHKQVNAGMMNQEAVAVSKYSAVTVQTHVPAVPLLDMDQMLLNMREANEAGESCVWSVLKETAAKNFTEVDVFKPTSTIPIYTNAETLAHIRSTISDSFYKYSAPNASPAILDNPSQRHLQTTLPYDITSATSIIDTKLDVFNPTDYALALCSNPNTSTSAQESIRQQNEYLLTTIAPQYDADPATLIPDNITARVLETICDTLFIHPLRERDRNLVWKYRYYMRKYPRGIIKLLNSIPENYQKLLTEKKSEAGQGGSINEEPCSEELKYIQDELVNILYTWKDPSIDQILLLLSKEYSTHNLCTNIIRLYAVNKLNEFPDSVILQFLMELTFKIPLDETLCIVDLFNYHELYESIEDHLVKEAKELEAGVENALSNITPIMSTASIANKSNRIMTLHPSVSSLENLKSRSLTSEKLDARRISGASGSSQIGIRPFGQHSFMIDPYQFSQSQQLATKQLVKKSMMANEGETPGLFASRLAVVPDTLIGTIDVSCSDFSDDEPNMIFDQGDCAGTDHPRSNNDDTDTEGSSQQFTPEAMQTKAATPETGDGVAGVSNATNNADEQYAEGPKGQKCLAFKNLSDLLIARAISAPYTFYLFYFYVDLWYHDAVERGDINAQQKMHACRESFYDIMREKDPEFFSCLRSTLTFSQQLVHVAVKSRESDTRKRLDQQELLKDMIRSGDNITALRRKETVDNAKCMDDDSDLGIDADKPGIIFPFVSVKNHQEDAPGDASISVINLRQPLRHKRVDSFSLTNIVLDPSVFVTDIESSGSQLVQTQSVSANPQAVLAKEVQPFTSPVQNVLSAASPAITVAEAKEQRPDNVLIVDKNERYVNFKNKFIHISGINADKILVLKSAKRPILIHLIQAETGRSIPVLLKIDDDVRLDMLHLHFFSLMDNYLQAHSLDMQFSIYSCFSLTPSVGFIECILPSSSQDDIINERAFSTISNYFNGMICRYRNQVSTTTLSQAIVKLPMLLNEISVRLCSDEAAYLKTFIFNESFIEGKAPSHSPGALSDLSEKTMPSITGNTSVAVSAPFGESINKSRKRTIRPSNLSSNITNSIDVCATTDELLEPLQILKDSNHGNGGSHVLVDMVIEQPEDSYGNYSNSQSGVVAPHSIAHVHNLNKQLNMDSNKDSESETKGEMDTPTEVEKVSIAPTMSQARYSRGPISSMSMQLATRTMSPELVQKWLVEQLMQNGIDSLPRKIRDIINTAIIKIYGSGENLACMTSITKEKQRDNFIKSTAAYSVITYLLAVGDRHGENILIRPDGRMFHIDFGWCFGKDPKPMSPQMKISKDLVKAMGGTGSAGFDRYLSYVSEIFCILRKDVHIIIALMYMLQGGGMASLDEAAQTGFDVIEDKYQLGLDKDAAIYYIVDVVQTSMKAIMGQVIDAFHRFTQGLKK